MKKIFYSFIHALCLSFIIQGNVYANNQAKDGRSLQAIVKGRALLIDMDANDKISKQTFLKGKDLILVKTVSVFPKKNTDPLQFQVVAFSKAEDLINIDLNHDGIIEKAEMAKANVALIRYNDSGDITIEPLADSLIKQINYTRNNDGSLHITVITNTNKKFKGYFIDL